MSKIFFETVGCPKNQVDSEGMAGFLICAGHEVVFSPEAADVIIVNTCGFIKAAKRESIETIFEYVPYKEEGRKLIVTGCLSQRYPEELKEELPEADAILGVNEYDRLAEFLSIPESPAGAQRFGLTPRYSAYLKIAEGCSNNCAYCVIPIIRGPYRSVPMEELAAEAEALAGERCKELIIVAQDVTAYGIDLYGKGMLPELLRKLCAVCGGIEWIRLLYCYEELVTDELIEVMASETKILKYIDLPLQHVNDGVLKSMRRRSTKESIRETITRLRAAMPEITIRTTFITGLPGEGDEEFDELYDFVEEMRFERLGVFTYSPEEGTDAAMMEGRADSETAEARRDAIMQLQQEISLENNRRFIGTRQDVIVCEKDEDGVYIGRTRGDAPDIDGEVIFSAPGADDGIIGKIVKVRVSDAMDYDLSGEVVV